MTLICFTSMLRKPISTWFLALLKQRSRKNIQKYIEMHGKKIKLLAYIMQDTANSDKLLPIHSFVLLLNFKAVCFFDKLKPLRSGLIKIINAHVCHI